VSGSVRRFAAIAATVPVLAALILAAAPVASGGIPVGASLTIIKVTDPASDPQDFDFDLTGPAVPADLDLDTDAGSAGTPSQDTFNVSAEIPAVFTVIESTTAGWTLTGLVCTGGGANSSTNLGTRTATLAIDSGEQVICTFTNTKHPTTSLTLVKATSPALDPQDFDFDLTGAGFPADSDLDTDGLNATLPSQETFFLSELQLGAHTITESVIAGWVLTDIECTGGGDDSSVNLETRTATLDIDAGELVVCTFTNGKLPLLTLTKVTIPASDPQDFYLDVLGTVNTTLDTDPTSLDTPDSETFSLAASGPGEKTVEEGVPDGWTLTAISCPGDDKAAVDLENNRVVLDVDAGEDIHCTFTNTKDSAPTDEPTDEPATDEPATDEPTINPTDDSGGETDAATEPGTSTETKGGEATTVGVGVALVALILLSGVLLVTRPRRAGK
jgi:hypothetical protein